MNSLALHDKGKGLLKRKILEGDVPTEMKQMKSSYEIYFTSTPAHPAYHRNRQVFLKSRALP